MGYGALSTLRQGQNAVKEIPGLKQAIWKGFIINQGIFIILLINIKRPVIRWLLTLLILIVFPFKNLFYTGLIVGLLVILRESYLSFMLVLLIYLLVVKNKNFFKIGKTKLLRAHIAGVLFVILPVYTINFALSGNSVLTNTNGGINFHLANNEDAKGYFHPYCRH